MNTPTQQVYQELQDAYSFCNQTLFADQLPECLITMQRTANSYGFYRCQPFVNRVGDRADEIALNPAHFATRTEIGVLSTLVHEMAHLQQYHFGKPGRRGYHNRAWANQMIGLGLCPSNTGEPGGKQTGYQMTHYIVDGGQFDRCCSSLLHRGYQISWQELPFDLRGQEPAIGKLSDPAGPSNRWKYTCPKCRNNAWGKPNNRLICGFCHQRMPRNAK